jgi:hypothetical protein
MPLSSYNKGTCMPMFITALFTKAKLWNIQDAPLLINGLRKGGIYTRWNFTQAQRKMKFCDSQVNNGIREYHLK